MNSLDMILMLVNAFYGSFINNDNVFVRALGYKSSEYNFAK